MRIRKEVSVEEIQNRKEEYKRRRLKQDGFADKWNAICSELKNSGYDLSKIHFVPEDETRYVIK